MNRATRIIAATIGIVFAIGGISHGFFEVLQGNAPTPGLFIDAISETHRYWEHGAEGAFTIIPNFLFTGLAAITVSIAIIVWCVRFLDTKHGSTVYLGLFVLLFLVGGGVGQVLFFTIAWAFATRINKPLTWWRRVLPGGGPLAGLWPWTLGVGGVSVVFALQIAVFGWVPGITGADQRLIFLGILLLLGLVMFMLSFISGFADDIARNPLPAERQASLAR